MITEFTLIDRYFKSQPVQRPDVILGIGDDCALLKPPPNQILAVTTDTLVAGVHFPLDTSAHAIGHKALAVSLSDLAAMGAEPAWATLSLTLPKADEIWLEAFCEGFFALMAQHNVQLVGGDTTQGPLTIATHLTGFVPPHQLLTRSGAQVGDGIFVTGSLGDAGLALRCLQNLDQLPQDLRQSVQNRLDYPTPRIDMGLALRGIASAAIDISDGLAADLGHILEHSGVGACLNVDQLPLSKALQTLPRPQAYTLALTSGDDYELCFTAPKSLTFQGCYLIGTIEDTPGLRLVYNDGKPFELKGNGYEHFIKQP